MVCCIFVALTVFLKGNEKGIRCKSGAVPAAVSTLLLLGNNNFVGSHCASGKDDKQKV
jgi:hypothetical protein